VFQLNWIIFCLIFIFDNTTGWLQLKLISKGMMYCYILAIFLYRQFRCPDIYLFLPLNNFVTLYIHLLQNYSKSRSTQIWSNKFYQCPYICLRLSMWLFCTAFQNQEICIYLTVYFQSTIRTDTTSTHLPTVSVTAVV
jgi:hypothetical protein